MQQSEYNKVLFKVFAEMFFFCLVYEVVEDFFFYPVEFNWLV